MLCGTSGFKAVCFPKLSHLKWEESMSLYDELTRFLMYVANTVLRELTLYISTFFEPNCIC